MMATDVAPTRLDAAKVAASDFVKSVPDGFNIALVSLSGNPAMRMSPTADHNAILHLISVLTPQDSSAIGDALMTALAAVAEAPPSSQPDDLAPAVIILLSDGGNTHGQSPLQIALQAKQQGIPIYTIAFGTQNGYIDLDDERYHVPPDESLMNQIADISGGESYSADNLTQLDRAYRNIHSEIGYVKVKKEITATYAWPSLVLAFIAAAGAVVLGVRFK
jgi:Ca-activated chloride channel family protein